MRPILLNPGPVTLSEGVRRAAVQSDLCHREPEFLDCQDRVRQKLLDVYSCDPSDWTSVLLGGSGTAALEAMLASLLPRDARLLVVENGVYGERLSKIALIHGIDTVAAAHGWMDAPDLERIEHMLSAGDITHLAAVHHETTTGRLNDLARLAALCEEYGVGLLLDAVSSFGAERIPFGSSALIACAATANKCLHGIPGACMVICRQSAIENAVEPPRSLYLHLPLWSRAQDQGSTPFTPSVNSVLALDQALNEMQESGGWTGRRARYSKRLARIDRALRSHGVDTLLEDSENSCVLHSYSIPEGLDYATIHASLKHRGFIIYAGQGRLADGMFRISAMGDIHDYDMERLLAALHSVFGG